MQTLTPPRLTDGRRLSRLLGRLIYIAQQLIAETLEIGLNARNQQCRVSIIALLYRPPNSFYLLPIHTQPHPAPQHSFSLLYRRFIGRTFSQIRRIYHPLCQSESLAARNDLLYRDLPQTTFLEIPRIVGEQPWTCTKAGAMPRRQGKLPNCGLLRSDVIGGVVRLIFLALHKLLLGKRLWSLSLRAKRSNLNHREA